jgi:hypothetical protein
MNEQVAIRVADLRFVLDVIDTPARGPVGLAALLDRVDPDRIGLMGMSVGGATVIDLCKVDARCRAGVNLDGGLFGQHQRRPLQAPFLSVVSAPNRIFGEHLLTSSASDYFEVLVEGAGHGDYCDLTFLMPFMKWLGVNGSIGAMRVVHIVNSVSRQFFEAYLRDGPELRFDAQEYPELRVASNVGTAAPAPPASVVNSHSLSPLRLSSAVSRPSLRPTNSRPPAVTTVPL